MRRLLPLACAAVGIAAADASAQLPEVRGYYLNVPSWTDANAAAVGGLNDVNRLRLMMEPGLGGVTLQAAYEHVVNLSQRPGSGLSGMFVGVDPGGGEWLPLQWDILDEDHVSWRHRFDRLNLRWAPGAAVEMAVGRMTASWATTLFLTPADPFLPFNPSDPFREYRAGVDAFRFQYFPGPLSDVDVVVRPADFGTGDTWTVLGRGRTVWKSWELSGWMGMLYDEPAGAVGAAGGIGPVAVRAELTVQKSDGDYAIRASVGIDGRLGVLDRDLYYAVEYQRDGFGAGGTRDRLSVVQSGAFQRGQMQVLGRDEFVAQGSFQAHPLWAVTLLTIANLNDPSALVAPGLAYSVGNEATLTGGLYFGFGDDTPTSSEPIPSEYGLVPILLYGALTVFF